MLQFIIGFIIGTWFGIIIMCLMAVAKHGDE